MNPRVSDPDFTLWNCDVLEGLAQIPDASVHCVVTSPPYYGLRDYGTGSWEGGDPGCDHVAPPRGGARTPGAAFVDSETDERDRAQYAGACRRCGARRVDAQLGVEATPREYVDRLVEILSETRRVLRDDGTLWLNLGDSYAGAGLNGSADFNERWHGRRDVKMKGRDRRKPGATAVPAGLKAKDLVGVPWRAALALQDDGWYLRAEIIWEKSDAMPESVNDRPTRSHEQIFLLAKQRRYFYDRAAIAEPLSQATLEDGRFARSGPPTPYGQAEAKAAGLGSGCRADPDAGRNARSVWRIATGNYPGAHFAVFPEEVPRRCVLAGTSERGCCPGCGAPWERATRRVDQGYDGSRYGERAVGATGGAASGGTAASTLGSSGGRLTGKTQTVGWHPGCGHGLEPVPCTVLDPFLGSGTTAHVARKLGRRSIGIELNPTYCDLVDERMRQQSLFAAPA